jgi:hypothetical protein
VQPQRAPQRRLTLRVPPLLLKRLRLLKQRAVRCGVRRRETRWRWRWEWRWRRRRLRRWRLLRQRLGWEQGSDRNRGNHGGRSSPVGE